MGMNLRLLSTDDNRYMAFRMEVKPKRWSRITNALEEFASRAVREIMGEDHINNDFLFRFAPCVCSCRDLHSGAYVFGLRAAGSPFGPACSDCNKMPPKKSDSLVWKYVTRDGNELFCKECKKPFKGSLTRARDHLLGISGGKGGGVSACPKMTTEMRAGLEREQSSSIVGMLKTTQKKQRIQEDVSKFTSISSSSSLPNASSSLPKATGASGESGTLKSFWKPVEKQQVDDALADLFYTSAIPFNMARNPHFRNAIQKVAEFGKGYTPPTSEAFRTTLLERSKDRVTENNFWESGAKVLNICGPIVDVLRMVDGDTPCLGMLYESMDRCKESIQRALNNVEAEYMEIWETVDSRWKMMHTPLHASACYLEPKLFHIDRQADPEIMPRFYEAISRSANDSTSSSQQQISEGMVTGVADEPKDDFVDDELGSDTDDDDATAATQPCALDDLELF
ncbi:hypothetical protein SUGI_0537520 [Cryptomeria japonica]|nr:hypothetical protein SUGI_0537520 [Cryptomeria japonica]